MLIGKWNECEFCGVDCEPGTWVVHHLYQRSTHPHLVEEKDNLIVLCGMCHLRVHDSRDLELHLRETYYGKTSITSVEAYRPFFDED